MRFVRQSFFCWILAAFCMTATALRAQTLISAITDPQLAGGTTLDFDSVTPGSFNPLNLTIVTFGPSVTVDSSFSGQYNNPGQAINNNGGGVSNLTIDFSTPVAAFGFNFGASDVTWTLSAFDSSNTLLASTILPILNSSNNLATSFFGLGVGSAAIAHVTMVASGTGDYIFIDNFRFTAVPEPSIPALLAIGVLGLGLFRRFRRVRA